MVNINHQRQHKRFKYTDQGELMEDTPDARADAPGQAAASGEEAGQQEGPLPPQPQPQPASPAQQSAPPSCPLLHSGVLPMLLHHAAFTDDHSTICRLLCCSAEIQALILSHCAGLVTLSATDAVPHAWLWHYVPLLRGISLDYRLLSAGARSHAQESLGKSLQELEPRLKLCVFTSAHDRVSVNLLKRLPVAALTRLVFCDSPNERHQQQLQRAQGVRHHTANKGTRKAVRKDGLLDLAQACRRLSALRELEVTGTAKDGGYTDFLLPQVAFLKHLTLIKLSPVLSPNKALSTHVPKGLRVLQLAYKPSANSANNPPLLNLAQCKALSRLELERAVLGHQDVLPSKLTHLQVGSCPSIEPLLSLQHLLSLAITGTKNTSTPNAAAGGGPVWRAPYDQLTQLTTSLTSLKLLAQALPSEAVLPTRLQHLELKELKDSVVQLTVLKRLTSLKVGTLEASAQALKPLTVLSDLAHISWGVVIPHHQPVVVALSQQQPQPQQPQQPQAQQQQQAASAAWMHQQQEQMRMQQERMQRQLDQLQEQMEHLANSRVPYYPVPYLTQWATSSSASGIVGGRASASSSSSSSSSGTRSPCRPLAVAELSMRGAGLNPTALQLIGHMRHLTGLKLQGSTGWVECGGATTTLQDPFRELSDPIRTWTQLQSLTFTGDVWRLTAIPQLLLAAPQQRPRSNTRSNTSNTAAAGGGGGGAGSSAAAAAANTSAAKTSAAIAAGAAGAAASQPAPAAGAPAVSEAALTAVTRAAAIAAVDAAVDAQQAAGGLVPGAPLTVADQRSIAIAAAETLMADVSEMVAAVELRAAARAAGGDGGGGVDGQTGAAAGAAASGERGGSAAAPAAAPQAAAAAGTQGAGGVAAAAAAGSSAAALAAAKAADEAKEAAAIRAAVEAAAAKAAAEEAAAAKALQTLKQQLYADQMMRFRLWAGTLAAAVGSLTQLTELDLSGWSLGESVTSLRSLTRLRSLNIDNTSQSDFSLLGLLPTLGLLTRLSVGGNLELTRAPLAPLELLLPELAVLDVKGNVRILQDRGFKEWREKHPKLTVLGDV